MTIRVDPPHGATEESPSGEDEDRFVASLEVLKDYFVELTEEVRRRNRGQVDPGEN